jgi:FMN-dependent NADH-azoreductase
LLRIDSSARRNSVSRHLTARFADAWLKEHPEGTVIERDLTTTALPHIADEWVHAVYSDPATLTAEQKRVLQVSDELIDELVQADPS